MLPVKDEKENIDEEIRREFQLDRIILFSDAVFAIVITLMAIEMRIPHEGRLTYDMLVDELIHLIPVIGAYIGSFFFIGATWYHHLRMFGLLRTYDKGLVIRNLILLFFIGFFPFSASLVATVNEGFMLPVAVYFIDVMLCTLSQLRLQHYILKHPKLRTDASIEGEWTRFRVSRFVNVMMVVMFGLVTGTFYLIKDPGARNIAWWWFMLFPVALKIWKKKRGIK